MKDGQIVESHRLSDGTLCEITRFGRKYTFLHTSQTWMDAPVIVVGITKNQALKLLGDALEEDVMERDYA